MTTPENKTTTYAYDNLNRLVSIMDSYNKKTTYDYDSLSRRTKTAFPNQATAFYTYDGLNNLVNLVNKTQTDEVLSSYAYEYDKAGNRLAKIEPELKTAYTYDTLYRLNKTRPFPVNLMKIVNKTRPFPVNLMNKTRPFPVNLM